MWESFCLHYLRARIIDVSHYTSFCVFVLIYKTHLLYCYSLGLFIVVILMAAHLNALCFLANVICSLK